MWKARVQFGAVDVPVKLYSAVEDIAVHSHLLHDQDYNRLSQRMVCPQDGKAVAPDDIVKGYEIAEGEYVIIEPDELDFLEPQASRQISVTEFVHADDVDPRYLDRTYYLGPDADEQLYVNFAKSLGNTNMAGMCEWVMRKKSYIGVLKFQRGVITLTTHRYASEIVSDDAFKIEKVKLSQKETRIAKNLIAELEEEFHPENYHEQYQAKLQKLIDRKAKGKKVELPALEQIEETDDKHLLNALEKSLDALKK
jgi:DNA end-binding protein Ku